MRTKLAGDGRLYAIKCFFCDACASLGSDRRDMGSVTHGRYMLTSLSCKQQRQGDAQRALPTLNLKEA